MRESGLTDILRQDKYVLVEPDKKLGIEKEVAHLSSLNVEQQARLFNILFHTEPGDRERVVRIFLARLRCRYLKDNGMIMPDALLSLAKSKLWGDNEAKKSR